MPRFFYKESMMIWHLIQVLLRLSWMVMKKCHQQFGPWVRQVVGGISTMKLTQEVSESPEEPLQAETELQAAVNPLLEPVATGQSLVRYGDGYSVVARFYRAQQRVSRVVWLNYPALKRKHGAYLVKRLRSRAGGEFRRRGMKPLQPEKDWGRLVLPDENLEFDSLQDLRVIRFMERSVEDVGILIEEEIPDGGVTKSRWIPPQPVVLPLTDLQKRTRVVEMTPAQLQQEDQARKKPLATEEKTYANLQAPVVTTRHEGTLKRTGYVERTDPSGRRYRTFYAEVDDGIRTVRHTGVDLQRALLREQVELGDRVEVFNLGLVPVGSGKYRKKIWSARKVLQA
jgi:hypothetical protein